MYNGALPITVTIPLGLKQLDVIYYLKQINVNENQKTIGLNTPLSYLYLRLKTSSLTEANELGGYKSISYPITELNHSYVKNVFMEGKAWLHDLRDEIWTFNGPDMIFSNEYKNLSAVYVDEYSAIKTALKIIPGIQERSDGKYERVIILAINTNRNRVILKEYEYDRLSNFILDFDFIKFNIYIMNLINYSYFSGSYKEFNKIGGDNQ